MVEGLYEVDLDGNCTFANPVLFLNSNQFSCGLLVVVA